MKRSRFTLCGTCTPWYSGFFAINGAFPLLLVQAYVAARRQGSAEAGDVLLDMSQALLSFNYRDTFVNAFDVRLPPRICLTILTKLSAFKVVFPQDVAAHFVPGYPSVLLSDCQLIFLPPVRFTTKRPGHCLK